MPIAPIQKFLPIRCELRLPTVDLAGARSVTGLDENTIKLWIEAREIIAWDISRSNAASAKSDEDRTRRELRILTVSARNAADGRSTTYDDDKIIRLLYGPEKPFILGRDFRRSWNCDSGHMINLVDDQVLAVVKGTDHGRGRGRTPCITWSSAVAFLKQRRLS